MALLFSAYGVACGPSVDQDSDAGPGPTSPYAQVDCRADFDFSDGRAHQRVFVAGEFNDWSETASRLSSEDGLHFQLRLALPPGDYAYVYLVDGVRTLDPLRHRRSFKMGDERSRRVISSEVCARPRLVGESFALSSGGELRFEAHFEAVPEGSLSKGPDEASLEILLDGVSLGAASASFDSRGRLKLEKAGLEQGKHRLEVRGADLAGRPFDPVVVTGFVEASPFEWRDALIYFPMTDRFRNGDSSLDAPVGVEAIADFAGGDFDGIRASIEDGSFAALGVNTLWLSPLMEGPEGGWAGQDGHRHADYHGYWPASPRQTASRFGSMEALQALTKSAHQAGMRVIADLVFNHVHETHPYASEPGFVHLDGACVCGSPGCGWDEKVKTCWFTDYLPDLDWQRDALSDAMVDDALYWFDRADLDGFRVDAVKHFERRALADLRAGLETLRPLDPRAYLVGETFTGEGDIASLLPSLGQDALDGQFDFSLVWTLLRVFARDEGSFIDLDAALQRSESILPRDAIMSTFIGNHDLPRFLSQAGHQIADLYGNGAKEQGWSAPPSSPTAAEPYLKTALAFAYLLSAPGAPLIYYGDELGMPGAGDPDNRRPMPEEIALSPMARSLREKVRALGTLRGRSPALRRGIRETLYVDADLWVQLRQLELPATEGQAVTRGEFVIVILNRSPLAIARRVPLSGALGAVSRLSLVAELSLPDQPAVADIEGGGLSVALPGFGYQVFSPLP